MNAPSVARKQSGLSLTVGNASFFIGAGPYRHKTLTAHGIKMAAEINSTCAFSVECKDFGVPDEQQMRYGLYAGLALLLSGHETYVGCMGGIGRTGTYLACLARVFREADIHLQLIARKAAFDKAQKLAYRERGFWSKLLGSAQILEFDYQGELELAIQNLYDTSIMDKDSGFDPVAYVRKNYLGHAVETADQREFIRDLEITDIARWLAHRIADGEYVVKT